MNEAARWAAGTVFVLTAVVLLLSPGGAGIIAAPVLLPLSLYLARRGRGAVRAVFVVLAGAVVALVSWAAMYVLGGGDQPAMVVFPAGAALLTIAVAYERLTVPVHIGVEGE